MAVSVLDFVITMVWACLQVPCSQNSLFQRLFTAIEAVSDIAAVASLTFAPGLLEALQATSPPDVSWFKNLPTAHLKRWGVYVLVFGHEDFIPYLYCGSATEMQASQGEGGDTGPTGGTGGSIFLFLFHLIDSVRQ